MRKQLIVFDLDGTLIDTLSDIEHIFNHVLKQNGYKALLSLLFCHKYIIGNGRAKAILNFVAQVIPNI